MKWLKDIVFYEGIKKPVGVLLKDLDLSLPTYRRKRNENRNAQEAFEYCLQLKERQNRNVLRISKENNMSFQAIYQALNTGKDISYIVSHFKMREQKREDLWLFLNQQEFLKKYKDFFDFCIQEGLNVSSVYKNLENGMNPYDAIFYSFGQIPQNIKYVFHRIMVKSLCQKYRLNYDNVRFHFKNTQDYEISFLKTIFCQFFSKDLGPKRNALWDVFFHSFWNDDIPISKDSIDDSILTLYFQVNWQFHQMQKEFSCYAFLEKIDISYYMSLSLEKRVSKVFNSNITHSFSLEELYFILDFETGLMSDFCYLEAKNIWVYKGNRKILEKLKPSY